MEPEDDIFSMEKFESALAGKSKPVSVERPVMVSANRIEELEKTLDNDSKSWSTQVTELCEAARSAPKLNGALPSILTLRQRLLEQIEWFERKCAHAVSSLRRQEAKLKNDWQAANMKVTEQNARLKGENAYLEEERALLQGHVDFLRGNLQTLDHLYYLYKQKMQFDAQYNSNV